MTKYTGMIVSDYKIMLGKPVIKGTRITVELILKKFSEGATIDDLLEMYPHLTSEQLLACFEYVAEVISQEEILEYA